MSAQGGDPGMGFSLMLDAARKTEDPRLFQRAVEIALQARAGESALQAARSWQDTLPDSREANRFVLQILIAINRLDDVPDALHREVELAAPAVSIAMLVYNYANARIAIMWRRWWPANRGA